MTTDSAPTVFDYSDLELEELPVLCPECEGQGSELVWIPVLGEHGENICPTCDGSGTILGE